PSPAAAPRARAERGEARRARRWDSQAALVAGIAIKALLLIMSIGAPLFTSYSRNAQNLNATLLGPSAHHLLGTAQLGRDTWTRLPYGTWPDGLGALFAAPLSPTPA